MSAWLQYLTEKKQLHISITYESEWISSFHLFEKPVNADFFIVLRGRQLKGKPCCTGTDRQMASTKEVQDHHLKCFAAGDLEGILFDYAPGAVLFTPDRPLKGAEAIRPLFQAMVAEFGKPEATFSMKQQFIEGDYAYILWSAETVDNVYEMGTDTIVVRDDKIVAQSFTGKVTPKG